MIRLIAAVLCVLFLIDSAAMAQDRVRLGYGRLVTNDLIGDGHDRWRTASIASSRVWGPDWTGSTPSGFGQLLELRLGAEIISPENITAPGAGDRPYAGSISVGLHTHFQTALAEFALGGDLVFTGPQTQLDDFQDFVHDAIGGRDLSSGVRRNQIGDGVNPTGVFEMARTLRFGGTGQVRPFVEARAGVETLVRVGADVNFGGFAQDTLLVRDPVTGHRYQTIGNDLTGFSFMMGADIAHVEDSEFLTESRGFELSDARSRVRAGVHYQSAEGHRAFYGLTWLDKEFKGQQDSQIVGSVRLHISF